MYVYLNSFHVIYKYHVNYLRFHQLSLLSSSRANYHCSVKAALLTNSTSTIYQWTVNVNLLTNYSPTTAVLSMLICLLIQQ